jgi:MoaA/NifB/PqqE/SkfB family radical SAM enzyme
VVQIHPTLRCNLACLHCYSNSSPSHRATLALPLVLGAIADAAAEGYTAISISGGEPLIWPGLTQALHHARSLGLVTALTTNLMPLTPRRLADIAPVLDLMAISLDGNPDSHDRMRGRRGAFATMAARLPGLRASGIAFGFIFTLTERNLHELAWVADFAIEQGARLLQVHPLEEAGRAAETLHGAQPGNVIANAAYLACMRLQDQLGDMLAVQLDLAHRDVLRAEPWRGYAVEPPLTQPGNLSDRVGALVIEPDGSVVPVQYGFSRVHALGNLHDACLRTLAEHWLASGGFERLCAHCEATVARETADPEALPAFNWFEALAVT